MPISMKRRVEVFKENIRIASHDSEGAPIYIDRDGIMRSGTIMYDKPFSVEHVPTLSGGKHTCVKIINEDCLKVAEDYIMSINEYCWYNRTAVLNCGSYITPGGGVARGSGGQEEELFRRTNLFRSLFQYSNFASGYQLELKYPQYPLDKHYGGVYSPDVTVFRSGASSGYAFLKTPYFIDVITASSVKNPKLTEDGHFADDEDISTVKDTIRTIFRIGLQNSVRCMILCPIGCGAYGNPPEDVATYFMDIMEESEFKDKYENIIFAIIDRHPVTGESGKGRNYAAFSEVFNV